LLSVTTTAAQLIEGLVTEADLPISGGLRIGRDPRWNSLRLSIAAGPAAHESVVREHRASVFVDRGLLKGLAHQTLDATQRVHSSAFYLRKPATHHYDPLAGLLDLLRGGLERGFRW